MAVRVEREGCVKSDPLALYVVSTLCVRWIRKRETTPFRLHYQDRGPASQIYIVGTGCIGDDRESLSDRNIAHVSQLVCYGRPQCEDCLFWHESKIGLEKVADGQRG